MGTSLNPQVSEYLQTSFQGGMNLLADDTRLNGSEYRIGFNVRNRYDVLDQVKKGKLDTSLPAGIKQETITFGEYVVAFVAGEAYYRRYDDTGWRKVEGFAMSTTAPRYWTAQVPVATTNYVRISTTDVDVDVPQNPLDPVDQLNILSGSFGGDVPGLLVQDNISQPKFIYIDSNGIVQSRTTRSYDEWEVVYSLTTGALTTDNREYVPIGNAMAWVDGVLYIASQDGNYINRSVSGRPLDFVINVKPDGDKGGDASTTNYSVGVGGISCLRATGDGHLFVSASNANFIVQKNMTPSAPTIFGEYTFIRKYVFEATCLGDRAILDSMGDTRFVDLNGIRSFNAILQLQNEGRNSPFTAKIAAAFKEITQDVGAAILFDNYEFYALNTIYGPVIAVYDTITNSWCGFDTEQTGGSKIKQFAKIDLGVQSLYAITEDDQLYELYAGGEYSTSTMISLGVTSRITEDAIQKLGKNEIKPSELRCVVNRITQDSSVTAALFVDNRQSQVGFVQKDITYRPPPIPYTGDTPIPDVNSQLTNLYWMLSNSEQGWKVADYFKWTGGCSLTQFSATVKNQTPLNPPMTQSTTV